MFLLSTVLARKSAAGRPTPRVVPLVYEPPSFRLRTLALLVDALAAPRLPADARGSNASVLVVREAADDRELVE